MLICNNVIRVKISIIWMEEYALNVAITSFKLVVLVAQIAVKISKKNNIYIRI